jgi:hypothetical protein
MNTMHNLGLPASECAKLVPARPTDRLEATADIVRASAAEAEPDAVSATRRRLQHGNRLSGFARA